MEPVISRYTALAVAADSIDTMSCRTTVLILNSKVDEPLLGNCIVHWTSTYIGLFEDSILPSFFQISHPFQSKRTSKP
ncbi:hypothetical protein VTL71DRAFT_12840 [Oculimacula yallundae]|uniref:Uncharacterized protein n=1 Tax=Oculimacula yallundae TaxID=86028 RepID=A0ABR4CP47_9HELO